MVNTKFIAGILILVIILGAGYAFFGADPTGQVVAEDNVPLNTGNPGTMLLNTKSTGGEQDLGCGPPNDFDCGLNRYSGYMALANIKAFENTGDATYLDYAIQFALTEQTNPPDWCTSCICNPPDDFDCGMGEVQGEMMQVFARLYQITAEPQYLEYAEEFAHTIPSNPPESCTDCICGPPDDFDCGAAYVQTAYLTDYKLLYDITGKSEYLSYIKGLGIAWQTKTIEEIGPRLITFFLEVYDLTGDTRYYDHALELASDMLGNSCDIAVPIELEHADHDEAAYLDTLASLYRHTEDGKYLLCAHTIVEESIQCPDGVCRNMVQQASMITQNIHLYTLSGVQDFMEFAERFAELDNINAVKGSWHSGDAQCENFDCEDAEGQAFLARALLELAEVKEH